MFDDDDFNFDEETLLDIEEEKPSKKLKLEPKEEFKTPSSTKRKFPGPAGLLPERNASLPKPETVNPIIACSQNATEKFTSSPWLEMLKDYGTLPDKHDIRWIKNEALRNKLIDRKAPFLAAIVRNVQNNSINLQDRSGSIDGTVVSDLYEEHSEDIVAGSVLVLEQFGVLTNLEPYLTITRNNLVAIYVEDPEGCRKVSLRDKSKERLFDNEEVNYDEIFGSELCSSTQNSQIADNVLADIDTSVLFDEF